MFGKTTKTCRHLTTNGKAYGDSSSSNLKTRLARAKTSILSMEGMSMHVDGSSQLLNDRFRPKTLKSQTFKDTRLTEPDPAANKTTSSNFPVEIHSSVTSYLEARKLLRSTPNKQSALLGAKMSNSISNGMYQPVVTQTVNGIIAKSNLRKTPSKQKQSTSIKSFESEKTARSFINQKLLQTPTRNSTPFRQSKEKSPPFSSARKALRKVKRKSPPTSPKSISSRNVACEIKKDMDLNLKRESANERIEDLENNPESTGEIINMQSILRVETSQKDGHFSALVTVFRVSQIEEDYSEDVILVLGPKCILVISPSDDKMTAKVTQSLQREDIKSLRNEGMTIEIPQARLKFKFGSNSECLNFMHLFYIRRPIGTPAARRLKEQRRLSAESEVNRGDMEAGYDVHYQDGYVCSASKKESICNQNRNVTSVRQGRNSMNDASDNLNQNSIKNEIINTDANPASAMLVAISSRGNSIESETSSTAKSVVDARSAMLAAITARGDLGSKQNPNEVSMKVDIKCTSEVDTRKSMVGSISSKKSKPTVTNEDEEKISKYKKMLKMQVPAEAVRHKMILEGIEERLIASVLGEVLPSNTEQSKNENMTSEEKALVAKYQKMIKMNVPPPAVRHKMTLDGIDEHLIRIVCNDGPENSSETSSKVTGLSEEDEKTLLSYRKMSKILPEDALRHKMKMEGVDDRLVSAFFGKSRDSAKKLNKGKNRGLISLHWTPLSPTSAEQSFWSKTPAKSKTVEEKDLIQLEQLFSRKKNNHNQLQSLNMGVSKQPKHICILEANRVRNITITLTSFNKIFESHDDLLNTIKNLDPKRRLVGDNLQFLEQLLPQEDEVKVLKSFKGNRSDLQPSEIFIMHLAEIPRINEKVEVIQTLGTFLEITDRLTSNYNLLSTVCNQIRESERLTKILDTVREVGNFLNEGTHAGGVSGFKLESLLKLTETKSTDGKTTVLDYIVQLLIKDDRESLMIIDDLGGGTEAARIIFNDLVTEGRRIKDKVEKCKNELREIDQNGNCTSSGINRLQDFIFNAEKCLSDLAIREERARSACRTTAINFGEKNGEQSAISVIEILVKFAKAVNNAVDKYDARMAREQNKTKSSLKKSKSRRKSGQGIQLRRRRSSIRARSSSRSPLKQDSIKRSPVMREISKRLRSPKNGSIPTLGRRMERSAAGFKKVSSGTKIDFSKV